MQTLLRAALAAALLLLFSAPAGAQNFTLPDSWPASLPTYPSARLSGVKIDYADGVFAAWDPHDGNRDPCAMKRFRKSNLPLFWIP